MDFIISALSVAVCLAAVGAFGAISNAVRVNKLKHGEVGHHPA